MSFTTRSGLVGEVDGDGAPAVVFIHAGIADRAQWDRERAIVARSHRAVTYDVRGFGASPDPVADHFDHDDVLEVLDTVGVARAVLVGSSNGGRIALDTAAVAPERVAGLVLAAPGLPGTTISPQVTALLDQEDAALETGDMARARDINLSLWVVGIGRRADAVDPALQRRVTEWLDPLLPRQAAAVAEAQEIDPPLRARLATITAPTLVLIGSHDLRWFHLAAHDVATGVTDGRMVTVDGAAHLINLERPDRFDAELAAFLARVVA